MNQWRKGIATWTIKKTLYISVPFTWLVADAEKMAKEWKEKSGHKAIIGGPGTMQPSECDVCEPILFHNPLATFTTRGCVNHCGFCAVPKLEPEYKEIHNFRPAPVICDNNFTAATRKHQEHVVDLEKHFPYVDFNQGLEARRFTPELADLLGNLKCKIRFAFDSWGKEAEVKDAIDLCRKRTTNDIGIMVLIGYKGNPEEDIARLELVRSWGILPAPMRYQSLDSKEKDTTPLPDGWTEQKMADVVHFYFKLTGPYRHLDFKDYHRGYIEPKEQLPLLAGDF